MWNQLGEDINKTDTGGRLGYRLSISSSSSKSGSLVKTVRVAFTSLSAVNNVSASVAVYELTNSNFNFNWELLGQPIETEYYPYYSPDTSVSLSSDGDILAVSDPKKFLDKKVYGDGYVEVYRYIDGWKQIGNRLQDSSVDRYGNDVSLSSDGKRLATIGNDFMNYNRSFAEVYEFDMSLTVHHIQMLCTSS